jgi:hypothetical protein
VLFGGDELRRRQIMGQIVTLAEKYAPDMTWGVGVMKEVSRQTLVDFAAQCRVCSVSLQWRWLGL